MNPVSAPKVLVIPINVPTVKMTSVSSACKLNHGGRHVPPTFRKWISTDRHTIYDRPTRV